MMHIAVIEAAILFFCLLLSCGQSLDLNEKAALVNFGNALGFSGWNDTAGDPCSWYGIVCSNVTLVSGVEETRVDINLGSLGLAGSLSEDIGNITSLRQLLLSSNELVGPIPNSITMLPNLELLDLSFNKLTGPLPATIGTVSQPLKSVQLHHNSLMGPIPLGFGNLPFLQTLSLANNAFSGPVFGLSDALTTLLQLQSLDLGFNAFNGSIPVTVDRLGQSLESLTLRNNMLSGPIPAVMGALTKLVRLDVAQNNLSGPIPAELGNLQQLQSFMAGFNQLSGALPTELGSLPDLNYLSLESNKLTGIIPDSFSGLTKLTTLNLGINKLTGPVPSFLGDLTALQNLALGTNDFIGPLPASLGNLQSLRYLYLNDLNLTGRIPPSFANLTKLFTLYLQSNLLNGSIPDFGQLASVNSLYLDNNLLTGPLPISIFSLPNLTDAGFSGNYINAIETIATGGQLPTAMWSLGALHNNCLGPTFGVQPQRDDSQCRTFYAANGINWTTTVFLPRRPPPSPALSPQPAFGPTSLPRGSAYSPPGSPSSVNPLTPANSPIPQPEVGGQRKSVRWASLVTCISVILSCIGHL